LDLHVKSDFLNGIRLFLPVQSREQKISLYNSEIQNYIHPIHPTEGRYANVTNAGLDAMDAEARKTSAADADGEVVWS